MQKTTYFHSQYGKQRGTTVMHRMRTWYNQQARLAEREGRTSDASRFAGMADDMSNNIAFGKAR